MSLSSIVNIITKDGTSKYSGQIKGYLGDYVSSDNIYNVMERIVSEYD